MFARGLIDDPSPLLHVFFDPLRLPHQIRNMLIVRLDESGDHFHVLLELSAELLLFLIAPGVAQIAQLIGKRAQPFLQFFVELFQHLGKSPKLARIDNDLRHASPWKNLELDRMPMAKACVRDKGRSARTSFIFTVPVAIRGFKMPRRRPWLDSRGAWDGSGEFSVSKRRWECREAGRTGHR
jgi:hypothetical protein